MGKLNIQSISSLKESAISWVKTQLTARIQGNLVEDAEKDLIEIIEPDKEDEFQELMQLMHQNNDHPAAESSGEKPEDRELRIYREIFSTKMDTFDFWMKHKSEFPFLFEVAMTVLSTPATTAPVERIFSQAGLCDGVKSRRVNLSDKMLESEVMMNINLRYLKKYFE